jgi:hypothetical protein
MPVDILRQLAEQHPEQGAQQWSSQVQPLSPIVISVVELPPFQSSEEQAMHHVPEEVGLLVLLVFAHRDVRKHLLLQNLLCIPQPPFPV